LAIYISISQDSQHHTWKFNQILFKYIKIKSIETIDERHSKENVTSPSGLTPKELRITFFGFGCTIK
jgi:hypothetical protein